MSLGRSARCWVALCPLLAAACAGNGPANGGGSSDFDRLQQQVFNVSCVSGPCHNSTSQMGNLNLSEGVSYGQLVGVTPDNVVARQAAMLRVEPFSPDSSFLLRKLTGPGSGEGARMPQGQAPLSQEKIDMIRSWIVEGAPGSEGSPTPTASFSPSPPPSSTPSATRTPTDTPTLVPSATPSITNTPEPTATPTTPEPTVTGTPPATRTPTLTVTVTPTPTVTDTATLTPTPTVTDTPAPTATFTIAPGSTLAELQRDIFTPTCSIQFCHNDVDGEFAGMLSLQAGSTYGQLVGVVPANATAQAAGLLRVDPGNPDNSFILIKLLGPTNPDLGGRMPSGGLPLAPAQSDLVRAWIVRGALPDETAP